MKRIQLLILLLLFASMARAELPGVLLWQSDQDIETVYSSVYNALEKKHFFVVFEPNIGKNLAGMADRLGEDYNRNKLTAIRSMVFCNAVYANGVSNLDPDMLALCPLHITLYEQQGKTHVVFLRPAYVSEGSAAQPLLLEIEQAVSAAIKAGLESATP